MFKITLYGGNGHVVKIFEEVKSVERSSYRYGQIQFNTKEGKNVIWQGDYLIEDI